MIAGAVLVPSHALEHETEQTQIPGGDAVQEIVDDLKRELQATSDILDDLFVEHGFAPTVELEGPDFDQIGDQARNAAAAMGFSYAELIQEASHHFKDSEIRRDSITLTDAELELLVEDDDSSLA